MNIDKDFHDKITDLCLKHFKTLPKSGKPKSNEWTILSCIVLEFNGNLNIVALGTGSKCIGKNKLSNSGDILNDSHAEVICRRSFLRFLYSQMKNCIDSSFLYFNTASKKYSHKDENFEDIGNLIKEQPNKREEAVCDDCEVPIKKSRTEDGSDIFRTGAKCLNDDVRQDLKIAGCAYHVLGAVRTKPGKVGTFR
ncbi:hypothetical protein NQ314_000169 [Rhamnusium bicolor]|uniref:tRNA-specific adenosine deaminase 1 n=1 Tax=Rhamnusium bicolor TaxID=1586634 RepID=A0AAV8ZWX9_9CUCU|nr:hypothetical protein NQ314_000169 [Rhamnusium bicolor]